MISWRFQTSEEVIEKWMKQSLGGFDEVHFGGMFLEQCQIAIGMGYMPPVPLSDRTSLWGQGDYSCCSLDITPPNNNEIWVFKDEDFKVGWYAIAYKFQQSYREPHFAQVRQINSQKELDEFITSFFRVTDEDVMAVNIMHAETKSDLLFKLDGLPNECIPIAWG